MHALAAKIKVCMFDQYGTVVDVFQLGYRMHGRVLRPASVVVSTGGPAAEE